MKPRRFWIIVDAFAFVYLTAMGFTYWDEHKASGWLFFGAVLALLNWRNNIERPPKAREQ